MTRNRGPLLIVFGCISVGLTLGVALYRSASTAEDTDMQTYRRHLQYPPTDIDTAVLQIMDCEAIAKRHDLPIGRDILDLRDTCAVRAVEILPFVRDDCGEVCRLGRFSGVSVAECGCGQ